MSSVISICIGGSGIKIGKAALEVNAMEHGIDPDGFFKDEEASRRAEVDHNVLFREDSLGRWTPRSIFIDLESEEIDSLLTSEIGQLVEPGQWYSGHEAGVLKTCDRQNIGKDVNWDIWRREVEQCDRVEDILVYSCSYGGAGSGLT